MKKITIKILSSLVALAPISAIAPLGISCSKSQGQLSITNKIDELKWLTETYQVKYTFKDQGDANVLFSSSNTNVATINEQGYVNAVGVGKTIIKAYSDKDENVCDKFELSVNDLHVEGTVKDDAGNPIKDVNVSSNGKTTTTNSDGKYEIFLDNPTAPLYFDKPGYFGAAYGGSYSLASSEHTLDVKLIPYIPGQEKTVNGTITKKDGTVLKNSSVTFYADSEIYKRQAITDENGAYSVKLTINPENSNVPVIVHNATINATQQIVDVSGETTDIEVLPYQYDIKAYVGVEHSNEKIIMHAYHEQIEKENNETEEAIGIYLESNFVNAFGDTKNFTLTFDNNNDTISRPKSTGFSPRQFSVTFNSNDGVTACEGLAGEIDKTKIKVTKVDNWHLNVLIPQSAFTENEPFWFEGTFGIHLDSDGRGIFSPYDHAKYPMDDSNELCYVRLDEDDAFFSASDNDNPFGLEWDTQTEGDWIVSQDATDQGSLGYVASKYNYGYQVKIAKNVSKTDTSKNGLYIMTKYAQDQMSHYLPDAYQPHFYFDPVQWGESENYPEREITPNVKHIAPISGYWLQQFDVLDAEHEFENKKEYSDIFDSSFDASPKIYSRDDLMITYIPYSFLNYEIEGWPENFNDECSFGFACSLQFRYTDGEWYDWQGKNPTGYQNIPKFKERQSYIWFNKELNIIPYQPK